MSDATPSTVVCTATHPVDLDDGTSLGPGQKAEDVDTSNTHNKALISTGALTVIDDDKSGPSRGHQKQTTPNDNTNGEVTS